MEITRCQEEGEATPTYYTHARTNTYTGGEEREEAKRNNNEKAQEKQETPPEPWQNSCTTDVFQAVQKQCFL